MRTNSRVVSGLLVIAVAVAAPMSSSAQTQSGVAGSGAASSAAAPSVSWPHIIEYGIDAEALFGVGDVSTTHITVPAGRFRMAWFLKDYPRWALEPAASFDWTKLEHVDGVLVYDVEVGALYQLTDFIIETGNERRLTTLWSPYVRPFLGVVGVSDGGSTAQFTAGAGFGVRKPLKDDFAARFEVNGGWAFNPTNFRIGFLAGLSFFPH